MGELTMQSAQHLLSSIPVNRDGAHEVDGLLVCDTCGKPRQMVAEVCGKSVVVPVMCDCMQRAEDERRAADERRVKAQALKARRARAFQGQALEGMTFGADDGRFGADVMAKAKAYARRFSETAGGLDYGLLFFGPPDSGKTFASACIANQLLDEGFSVFVRSLSRMLSEGEREPLGTLASCDLLVLDDLGTERATSYGQEFVYAVIDARYSARKPLVVSTNLTRRELAAPGDVMSARIYGRVLESCLPVEVDTGRRRSTRERYEKIRKDLGF